MIACLCQSALVVFIVCAVSCILCIINFVVTFLSYPFICRPKLSTLLLSETLHICMLTARTEGDIFCN